MSARDRRDKNEWSVDDLTVCLLEAFQLRGNVYPMVLVVKTRQAGVQVTRKPH